MIERVVRKARLDPERGVTTPFSGEIRPWLDADERPLQSAGGHEAWAALPDKGGTAVGRFDTRTSEFRSIARYPEIFFDTSDLWVDEPNNAVYVNSEGDVLRLPLSFNPP